MTEAEPVAVDVKVDVQLAFPTAAVAVRVQGLVLKDPAARLVWVKSTIPVGLLGLVLVSVMVAVQVEA